MVIKLFRKRSPRRQQPSSNMTNLLHDIEVLADNDWITDSILSNCLSYLQVSSEVTYYMDPCLSALVKTLPLNELNDQLTGLNLKKYRFIFLYVNNHTSVDFKNDKKNRIGNGSHWSLLLFDTRLQLCFHLDSLNPNNHDQAVLTMEKFSTYLNVSFSYIELNVPRQRNNSDCGFEAFGNHLQLARYCNLYNDPDIFSFVFLENDTDTIRSLILEHHITLCVDRSRSS